MEGSLKLIRVFFGGGGASNCFMCCSETLLTKEQNREKLSACLRNSLSTRTVLPTTHLGLELHWRNTKYFLNQSADCPVHDESDKKLDQAHQNLSIFQTVSSKKQTKTIIFCHRQNNQSIFAFQKPELLDCADPSLKRQRKGKSNSKELSSAFSGWIDWLIASSNSAQRRLNKRRLYVNNTSAGCQSYFISW